MAASLVCLADRPVDVLFIGNDASLAKIYKLKLELDGYNVELATSGNNPVQQAQRHPPDLIFIDFRAPWREHIELVERLQANPSTGQIPLLILSECGEAELAAQGLRLEESTYVIRSGPPVERARKT